MYVNKRFVFFPFHVNCYFEGIEELEKNWEFEILLLFFLQPLPKPLSVIVKSIFILQRIVVVSVV